MATHDLIRYKEQMAVELSELNGFDKLDYKEESDISKNRYIIRFFMKTGQAYNWIFTDKEERDRVFKRLSKQDILDIYELEVDEDE
jgi:hypothetical protein